jgi:hypothetical protein
LFVQVIRLSLAGRLSVHTLDESQHTESNEKLSELLNVMVSPQRISSKKKSLGQRVPKVLNAAARFVDSLKINSTSEQMLHGRPVLIKRRLVYSETLAELANTYFRMAGIPIHFWAKTEEWRRWEVKCFNMLNGDRFRARASGANTVRAERLPGRSLWDHLMDGTLTLKMMEAAGQELRRAHQLWSPEFRGLWSHGDACMTNVIYDEKTGRARLIDFEIVHRRSLATKSRHADDLLVFLLDLLAIAPNQQWLALTLTFLKAYDNGPVLEQLKKELALPIGIAWIWWGVRTSFANPAKVKRRLKKIAGVLADLEYHRAFAVARTRKTRRASITCQTIRPGIPIINSRTRAIKESAKAASPGMPSKLPIRT